MAARHEAVERMIDAALKHAELDQLHAIVAEMNCVVAEERNESLRETVRRMHESLRARMASDDNVHNTPLVMPCQECSGSPHHHWNDGEFEYPCPTCKPIEFVAWLIERAGDCRALSSVVAALQEGGIERMSSRLTRLEATVAKGGAR
jgi:Zn finger protein HypA/HybF involved in hydrogenase expression